MGTYKIHRYSVKDSDQVFVDNSTLTDSEKVLWENYVAFVQSLPGYLNGTLERAQIDENTVRFTYNCKCDDGREEIVARKFFKELGTSSNTARVAYMEMLRSKGARVNPKLSYTEVEFANGHILLLRPNNLGENNP